TVGGDQAGFDLSAVGKAHDNARSASDMGVRHDEIGCPQDARAAATWAGNLDRYLLEPVGDPGQMRWRLSREKAAHRRGPGSAGARRRAGCSWWRSCPGARAAAR